MKKKVFALIIMTTSALVQAGSNGVTFETSEKYCRDFAHTEADAVYSRIEEASATLSKDKFLKMAYKNCQDEENEESFALLQMFNRGQDKSALTACQNEPFVIQQGSFSALRACVDDRQ